MEFSEVVKNRYSCRKFDGRPLKKDQLEAILAAGRLAPTAKNLQEQHVYVVQSPAGLAKLDSVTPCRYGASTALIVTFNSQNVFTYPGGKFTSGAEDAAIVATHMMLAATAIGVDSCWLNCFDPDDVSKTFDLPDHEVVAMILDLGFAAPDDKPSPSHNLRKDLAETVTYWK